MRNGSVGRFQGVLRAAERWWKTFAGKDFKKPDLGYKKKSILLSSDAVSCICKDILFCFKYFKECLSRHKEKVNLGNVSDEKYAETLSLQ